MRVQGSTSVGANSSSGNVLAGKQIEIVTKRSRVSFYAAAAAVGVVATVNSGSETLMEESVVSQANRFPVDPDDRMVQDVALPMDRLFLNFRNTTGAAVIVYWAVDVLPI